MAGENGEIGEAAKKMSKQATSKNSVDDFTEAHRLYLDQLDKAYDTLKFYVADLDVLNTDWPKYKEARERFNALLGDIFLFKSVWYEVRELREAAEDD